MAFFGRLKTARVISLASSKPGLEYLGHCRGAPASCFSSPIEFLPEAPSDEAPLGTPDDILPHPIKEIALDPGPVFLNISKEGMPLVALPEKLTMGFLPEGVTSWLGG
jgi:hypothetical protein